MAKAKRETTMNVKACDIRPGMMLASPRKRVTRSTKAGTAIMLELGKDVTVTVPAKKQIKVLSA